MKPLDIDHYRSIVEQGSTPICSAGLDARCDYVNPAWLAFTGRALGEELGDGWQAAIHPIDRERYLALYLERFARREALEAQCRLRRHDGVYRSVLVRGAPRQSAEGELAGFVASYFDVHDLPGSEASGESEFFDLLLDHLCVAGFDGYWKRLNPAWTRTLGWTAQEMMSRPVLELVHPEDRDATTAARNNLKRGEPLLTLTNRYRRKDGTYCWFEWRSVSDVNRELVYAVARDVTAEQDAKCVLRELTEAKEKLQRQLMFADRMSSVGTLAAGVAHEINNPLAYVITNLDMILEDLRGVDVERPSLRVVEWAQMADEARNGADRIRKIVRGLNTFARVEEEQRAVISVKPVLELSIDMALNVIRHHARLVKDYGPTPLVDVDASRLGQVFVNLLVNAAQALPEGDSEGNEIRIVTSTDVSGAAVVEIRDTGPGIAADMLDRIFDPFFTTKPIGVGTGLGLSICHNIVSSMGGQITASNRTAGGAIFRVTLPAAPGRLSPAPAALASEEVATTRAAVLVVDDERSIGVILARALRGHDVTAVTSAKQALGLIDSGVSFDVILSDLMMPGISGIELYETLLRSNPRLVERMVFMTGGAFTAAARAFLDRVPNERLEKPFEALAVRALVERFVK